LEFIGVAESGICRVTVRPWESVTVWTGSLTDAKYVGSAKLPIVSLRKLPECAFTSAMNRVESTSTGAFVGSAKFQGDVALNARYAGVPTAEAPEMARAGLAMIAPAAAADCMNVRREIDMVAPDERI
jgi:hypothetical protein